MNSLLLLEPFRSALTIDALEEDLVVLPKGTSKEELPFYHAAKDKLLRARTRQLFLLFKDISIIHYETTEAADKIKERGYGALSLIRLQDRGIVNFESPPADLERVKLWEGFSCIEDWWRAERKIIDELEPLILAQMRARGKLPDDRLYFLLKELRLNGQAAATLILRTLPSSFQNLGRTILEDSLRVPFDIVIISTVNEIMSAEQVAMKGTRIAIGEDPAVRHFSPIDLMGKEQIFEIVLDSLADDGLLFPIPASIDEIPRIKQSPHFSEFSEALDSWLIALNRGDEIEEPQVRKEVRKAVRQFRHLPKLDTGANIAAWVAIPIGFIPFVGSIAGGGLSLISRGMEKLAKRWRRHNNWVGICTKSKNE